MNADLLAVVRDEGVGPYNIEEVARRFSVTVPELRSTLYQEVLDPESPVFVCNGVYRVATR